MSAPLRSLDVTLAEERLAARLSELGLMPTRIPDGVDTGIPGFHLFRSAADVIELEVEDPQGPVYFASLEVRAEITDADGDAYHVLDLVTCRGESGESALDRCASTWVDVTFPPLLSLFTGEAVPGTMSMQLETHHGATGESVDWEIYAGALDLSDEEGPLAHLLQTELPPAAMVIDSLAGALADPDLHWCKLYASSGGSDGPVFGCSIDNQRSHEAEEEMRRKFEAAAASLPEPWEFRQFLAMKPV